MHHLQAPLGFFTHSNLPFFFFFFGLTLTCATGLDLIRQPLSSKDSPTIRQSVHEPDGWSVKLDHWSEPYVIMFSLLTVFVGAGFFFLVFLLPDIFCKKLQHTAAKRRTQQQLCKRRNCEVKLQYKSSKSKYS